MGEDPLLCTATTNIAITITNNITNNLQMKWYCTELRDITWSGVTLVLGRVKIGCNNKMLQRVVKSLDEIQIS